MLGLTEERYQHIYDKLKSNNEWFMKEIKIIQERYQDLKDFDEKQQHDADVKINELENKVLMLGYTFGNVGGARTNLYSKLDLILGYEDYERKYKQPTNSRMLNEKMEDLETIIDEFLRKLESNDR